MIAIDLPGFGFSEGIQLDIRESALFMKELIVLFKLQKIILVSPSTSIKVSWLALLLGSFDFTWVESKVAGPKRLNVDGLQKWTSIKLKMTVHFGSRPSPFGRTDHFRGTVHFKNLPLWLITCPDYQYDGQIMTCFFRCLFHLHCHNRSIWMV